MCQCVYNIDNLEIVSAHEGNNNLVFDNNLNYFLSVPYFLENKDPGRK